MIKSAVFIFSVFFLASHASAQGGMSLFGSGGGGGDSREKMSMEKQDSVRQGLQSDEFQKFMIDQKGEGKARPKFASLFQTARIAILKKDFAKAEKTMGKLHELGNITPYEQSHLHLLDYWSANAQGKQDLEDAAAAKVMATGAGNIEFRTYVDIGMLMLRRQFNNQDLGGAIETLTNLRKEPQSRADLDAVGSVVKKLDDLAAQQTDIMQKITTDETGKWSAKLYKQHFYFNGSNGEISTLSFNCTNKQTTLPYKQDSIMEIPDDWGSCIMTVNAKPNTTFNIVQMQKKPS
jgi:phage FluMu protein gp41